jgi:hypothetical protein
VDCERDRGPIGYGADTSSTATAIRHDDHLQLGHGVAGGKKRVAARAEVDIERIGFRWSGVVNEPLYLLLIAPNT